MSIKSQISGKKLISLNINKYDLEHESPSADYHGGREMSRVRKISLLHEKQPTVSSIDVGEDLIIQPMRLSSKILVKELL